MRHYALLFILISQVAQSNSLIIPNEWVVISTIPIDRARLKVDISSEPFGPNKNFIWVQSNKGPRELLGELPIGVLVQPNYRYKSFDQLDADFENSWGLNNTGHNIAEYPGVAGKDIGAISAWEISTGPNTVTVAVIDSGIDQTHEDLVGNIWHNEFELSGNGIDDDHNGFVDDIDGWNFTDQNSDISDLSGHGTFSAGIIGAMAGNGKGSRGIHWNAKLMAVKFLDRNGFGTTVGAIRAIEYAVKNNAQIINASWGGEGYDGALYETLEWVGTKGILVIAAAGNSSKDNDSDPRPVYPASFRLSNIISVAAYDNSDERAKFSNFGKTSVDIGAPGVAIFSTIPGGYRIAGGTSFAAPFVTGTLALLKSFQPELSSSQLKERIRQTSAIVHYYEKEYTNTAGRVHAYNALLDRRPERPKSPIHWVGFNTSISTPHPYANGTLYRYSISHPGAHNIKLHFRNFFTEACCDTVTLLDASGRRVYQYRGELGDFWSVDALGDKLEIVFESDSSVSKQGFEIDSYQVSFE